MLKYTKVCTIKNLLDSGASALIVFKDNLHKYQRIPKYKKNKWFTLPGIFNTAFILDSKFKLPELNHTEDTYANSL